MSDQSKNRYKLGTVEVSKGTGNDPTKQRLKCLDQIFFGSMVIGQESH